MSAAGPYTPARRAGDWVIVSGQVGLEPGVGLVPGGFGPELRRALANLTDLLAGEGCTLADVVKTTVFVADLADYGELNDIWMATFPEPRPTRAAVEVAALPIGARVEVEAWAYAPQN